MRYLITTMRGDVDAALVASELRTRGHEVFVHYGEDFPANQRVSLRLSAVGGDRLALGDVDLQTFDVVWNRRRIPFSMPKDIHQDDVRFCRNELRAFTHCMWDRVAPSAYWVNPLDAAANAGRKFNQLIQARAVGLAVPETLMSNDPDDIGEFLRRHGRLVYKSFMPAFWETESSFRSLYAVCIDAIDADAMALCPGIYQPYVRPDYELRVTVFGRNVFAIKHMRPATAIGIDSRSGIHDGVATSPYECPLELREKLMAFMARMGLRFACFDILYSEQSGYCFLEANEAGQFLWVEVAQPGIPMLDAFCGYLEHAGDDYVYSPEAARTTLAEVQARVSAESTQVAA